MDKALNAGKEALKKGNKAEAKGEVIRAQSLLKFYEQKAGEPSKELLTQAEILADEVRTVWISADGQSPDRP